MTNYAQPRVERNGCAMSKAARFFNRDVLPRVFRVKNAIRTRFARPTPTTGRYGYWEGPDPANAGWVGDHRDRCDNHSQARSSQRITDCILSILVHQWER